LQSISGVLALCSAGQASPRGASTVAFLRLSAISLQNDAKPRYRSAPLPNESPYEKHALQNYAKRFVSIRSQMLYPVGLRAPERESVNLRSNDRTVKSCWKKRYDRFED
jgi:hypothetical protein